MANAYIESVDKVGAFALDNLTRSVTNPHSIAFYLILSFSAVSPGMYIFVVCMHNRVINACSRVTCKGSSLGSGSYKQSIRGLNNYAECS